MAGPERSETWLALVQRGECSFVDKVREAQRLGARGVVVGGAQENAAQGDELVTMYSPGSYFHSMRSKGDFSYLPKNNLIHPAPSGDITVPSTYISHKSYKELMKIIAASNTTISGLHTVSLLLSSDEVWQWYVF